MACILLPAFCYAAPGSSAYVYVGWYDGPNSQTLDYQISAFAVAPDGSAQAVPGSPFSGPSRDLVAVSNHLFGDDGRYIETYAMASNGSLTATSRVDDFAYIPGGGDYWFVYALNPDPLGVALNTVVSCGSCNSYVFPWAIGEQGQLSFIGGPGLPGGPAKWAGRMIFSPDHHYAYTSEWEGSLGILQRNSDGSVRFVNPSGFVYPPPLSNLQEQVCMTTDFASSAQGYATVVWYGGGPGCNGGYILGNYTVRNDGLLQLVPGSGFTPQVYESTMAFDPTGTYLAVAGNGVQIFRLQSDGTAAPVTGALQLPGSPSFQNVLWDNAHHIYAITPDCYDRCGSSHGLYVFNFDGQSLTLAPGSPYRILNAMSLAVVPAS